MKRIIAIAALAAYSSGALAHEPGRLTEVAIVNRDSGVRLPVYYHRGEYWVAGEPGARYAIYVRNRTEERLLAVTSVDGVNVVTGQTAAWDQSGYVFGAGEAYEISGWRKSDAEVAAFAFTVPPDSYAGRTGRPENLGVIGLALFRERPVVYAPPVLPRSPPVARNQAAERAAASGATAGAQPDLNVPRMAPAPGVPPALGTAHGPREYSYAGHTSFVRRQSRPDEIIRIRYDSLEHLVALGVVRPPRLPVGRPDAFPGSRVGEYVPDPPG